MMSSEEFAELEKISKAMRELADNVSMFTWDVHYLIGEDRYGKKGLRTIASV